MKIKIKQSNKFKMFILGVFTYFFLLFFVIIGLIWSYFFEPERLNGNEPLIILLIYSIFFIFIILIVLAINTGYKISIIFTDNKMLIKDPSGGAYPDEKTEKMARKERGLEGGMMRFAIAKHKKHLKEYPNSLTNHFIKNKGIVEIPYSKIKYISINQNKKMLTVFSIYLRNGTEITNIEDFKINQLKEILNKLNIKYNEVK